MKKIAFIIDDSIISTDNPLSPHHYLVSLPIVELKPEIHEYNSHNPISFANLYTKLANKSDLKTSAFIVLEAELLIKKLLNEYEKIVICGISNKLSSSFNSWKLLIDEYFIKEKSRILIYPNYILGDTLFVYTQQILEAVKTDDSWLKIEELLEPATQFFGLLFVQDIDNLAKGGRISAFKALISKKLGLKILITYEEGELKLFSKELSYKGVLSSLEGFFSSRFNLDLLQPNYLTFWHTFADLKALDELFQKIQTHFPQIQFDLKYTPKPISVHVGSNSFAVVLSPKSIILKANKK